MRTTHARVTAMFFPVLLIAVAAALPAPAQQPALIPRSVFFGNAEKLSPQLSPDGQLLAYLAPDSGVLNVWVRTVGKRDDRPVTHDRTRPIYTYFWQGDSKHILHLQEHAGDENWRIYQTDLATKTTRDLTPFDSVQTQILSVSPDFPDQILVAWNHRDARFHDAYRLDLKSGRATLDAENPGDVTGWGADHAFQVRVAQASLPDGSTDIRVRDRAGAPWRLLRHESADETFGGVAGFTPDNRGVWLISSVGANAARLLQIDLATTQEKPLAGDRQFDASFLLTHPRRHTLQAVAFLRQRLEWEVVDSSVAGDLAALKAVRDGDFTIDSRDVKDAKWIISYNVPDGPIYYYLYDRATKRAELLFTHRPKLEQYTLAKMQPISFAARDSMTIYGYLTLPAGVEPKNLPLVLDVHGGPWGRDTWGWNREVQWLANRGYAVLQVNFRGSTGYGKAYLNAGDRQWGGKMHTDLLDGKSWAVAQGYADPQRVCIYGGSYGGYATLVGVAFTPDAFVCGAEAFGPSNIVTLIHSIPPYWATFKAVFDKRVGKVETEEEFLKSRSPLFKADQIKVPLLIVQGANDVRVKQAESDQIVAAMRKNGKDVEYIVFPDEGHGFARPENNLRYYAAVEAFLAKYLGGRSEPASAGEAVAQFTK